MRVLVKRGLSLIRDQNFEAGPVYVGRRPGSQIYLPDRNVSRQHAVLFISSSGSWMVQDLQSSNRTLLNGRPVTKMPLRDGDVVGISDFRLEVHFEDALRAVEDKPIDLGDTIVTPAALPTSVCEIARDSIRPLHLHSKRLPEFYQLLSTLAEQDDEKGLIDELTTILLKQLNAWHVWVGLRETTSGPLTCYGGKTQTSGKVSLEQLAAKKIIKEALDKETFILLPDVAEAASPEDSQLPGLQKLRSAIAAPIFATEGAYGIIYADNALDQPPYAQPDLDYLCLVSTAVAALAERIG